ncbi:MAG: cytochrome c biogenesis protein ResB [Cyanobacteria bacterium J06642_11]
MSAAAIQFIGSIRLAIPLLAIIGSILIGATFYEAEVGSAVVQQEIYKSSWFGGLMFLLAVNLSVSTLLRYPWRGARKVGFAIAHWGLVVIIAGSAAVIHLSVEGMLLARTDGGPVSTLRVEGDLLEVAVPGQTPQRSSLFIKENGTVVPDHLGDLSLLGYTNHAIKTVRFLEGAAVENPAVRLSLSSQRMGQTLERWVAVAPASYDRMDIGPAELQIVQIDTEQALQEALANPSKQDKSPVWGTLQVSGMAQPVDVKSNLGKAVRLGDVVLDVTNFWPDFRLDSNGQPETATQQLRNPAVQLQLSMGDVVERWFVFGNPEFSPIRTQVSGEQPLDLDVQYSVAPASQADAYFKVVVAPTGQLYYAARSSKGFKSGPLAMGDAVTPGWADFQITLEEYVPHARLERTVVPLPEGAEGGEPALQISTAAGTQSWIPWGEPTTVDDDDEQSLYVAFSPKLMRLPFALKLNDFIVERNEGSESVAMWTSLVTLIDPSSDELSERRVWMNHPTWFQGWKIAQASWNPGDLAQSTLQVKREPWWVTGLTWLGSLMVTCGVTVMFYGRAVAKKIKVLSNLLGGAESDGDSEGEENSKGSVAPIPIFSFFSSR